MDGTQDAVVGRAGVARRVVEFPEEFVIDAELVAVDRNDPLGARLLPMQMLGTAASRSAQPARPPGGDGDDGEHDGGGGGGGEAQVQVAVCIYAFDLLICDGSVLLSLPFEQRRAMLRRRFRESAGCFQFVQGEDVGSEQPEQPSDPVEPEELGAQGLAAHADTVAAQLVSDDDAGCHLLSRQEEAEERAAAIAARVRELCQAACAAGGEGLMVKALTGPSSTYAPAKRSENAWIKLKKDYLAAEGLCDTLDLVPIAAWRGSGRKAGWLSPFLVATYNTETEEFESVCKVRMMTILR